ncbi:hypothetical protein [Aeromicrobium sp. UC242_57]|uniref:hypothetical protein n=1 Tax=Aeromicrobium sp. UC242_57 TaxID=3374624 RepID=UPI0037B81E6F
MGLTGIVVEATIRLKRVETSYFLVDTERTPDLASLLDRLSSGDDAYPYSVAWFDTATTGASLGRSVITRGRSALLSDLDPSLQARALDFAAPQRGRVPVDLPLSMVNRWTARAFNALWYAKAPQQRIGEVQDITQFFHPLDIIGDWNRLYGPHGFCQYQFVVPETAREAFTLAVEQIAASGHISSLNVLKRFGDASPAPMSFPMPGWTLAVDLPVKAGLSELLSRLDALVAEAGGRIYLAKDSRASSETIHQMYPRLAELAVHPSTGRSRRIVPF